MPYYIIWSFIGVPGTWCVLIFNVNPSFKLPGKSTVQRFYPFMLFFTPKNDDAGVAKST